MLISSQKENRVNLKIPSQKKPLVLLMAGWALFLMLTLAFTPPFAWTKGSGLISVVARVGLIGALWFGYKKVSAPDGDSRTYENWRLYVGYAIVLTYVFSILPHVVVDFYQKEQGGGLFYVILVASTSLWPMAIWLVMGRDATCLAWGYGEKELKRKREIDKDKKKKKERQKQLKKERTRLANFWVEWVEPLLGAVLWVLVINHFIFQLYQIPSESMFSTFHTGDRVLVEKIRYAPNVPLTDYKLPRVSTPQIGDIIVFTNPKMEDPESEYYYNSVFSRVFRTFVYMITLTNVDIDKKADGTAKENMLVKRYIAGEGEKICLLNDRVWKKTAQTDWTPMDEWKGQREYGQVGLFLEDYPKLERQFETEGTRALYEGAVQRVNAQELERLQELLAQEKERFLDFYQGEKGAFIFETTKEFLDSPDPLSIKQNLYNYSLYLYKRERLMGLSPGDRDYIYKNWDLFLENYGLTVLYEQVSDLLVLVSQEMSNAGYLAKQLAYEGRMSENPSPYEAFMVKANLLYKIYRLKLYNDLATQSYGLENPDLEKDWVVGLTQLSVYTQGVGIFTPFDDANFPEYPAGAGNYIARDEHFVMGDNRYDSVDSRLGSDYSFISVDPLDKGDFSLRAGQAWDPHTIPLRLVHGRLRLLLFPFNRLGLF